MKAVGWREMNGQLIPPRLRRELVKGERQRAMEKMNIIPFSRLTFPFYNLGLEPFKKTPLYI
jgi:hypothetical protein